MNDFEKIEIRYPPSFRITGAVSVLVGLTASALCVRDHFRGNETATFGAALLFLLLFGSLGGFLVVYGGRRVTVGGETVTVRNGLPCKKIWRLGDIKHVRGGPGGLVFCGEERALFRLYDRTEECEQFLRLLERNGVEVDTPDRPFAGSQRAALRPQPSRRRFTVELGWLPGLVLGALGLFFLFFSLMLLTLPPVPGLLPAFFTVAAGLGAASLTVRRTRLAVLGDRLELRRALRGAERRLTAEVREIRVQPWRLAPRSVFRVKALSGEGRILFRLSCPALGFEDRTHALALLQYFRDWGIPVSGLEALDEGFLRLLERCFLTEEEGLDRCRQAYGRLEPVWREFEPRFSALGVRLDHGLLDRAEGKIPEKRPPLAAEGQADCRCGVFFRLLKEERLLCLRETGAPCRREITLLWGPPEKTAEEEPEAYYFSPPSAGSVRGLLAFLLQQTAEKRTYLPEQGSDGE